MPVRIFETEKVQSNGVNKSLRIEPAWGRAAFFTHFSHGVLGHHQPAVRAQQRTRDARAVPDAKHKGLSGGARRDRCGLWRSAQAAPMPGPDAPGRPARGLPIPGSERPPRAPPRRSGPGTGKSAPGPASLGPKSPNPALPASLRYLSGQKAFRTSAPARPPRAFHRPSAAPRLRGAQVAPPPSSRAGPRPRATVAAAAEKQPRPPT